MTKSMYLMLSSPNIFTRHRSFGLNLMTHSTVIPLFNGTTGLNHAAIFTLLLRLIHGAIGLIN